MTKSIHDLKFENLKTKSGNLVSYLDLGKKEDPALLFFHGFPGSAVQALIFYPFIESAGIRLIAINRPGYADSDRMRPQSPRHYVKVVEEFMDALGVKDFFVVGVSGGNPYAIATAAILKSRVKAMGSICGAAPFNAETKSMMHGKAKIFLGISRLLPARVIENIAGKILSSKEPHKRIVKLLGHVPDADRVLFKDEKLLETMLVSMNFARAQGGAGMSFDLKNFAQDWSDLIRRVECPWLLWHGSEDAVVNPQLSKWISEKNKNSKLRILEGEGHYSLPVKRGREILFELMGK